MLDQDQTPDVYVRDMGESPKTYLASVNADGSIKGNAFSHSPVLSSSGTRVAFASSASNLDPLDHDGLMDIYVRELDDSPTTFLVSVSADGSVKGNSSSSSPTISADGTRVAFVSSATNLDPMDGDQSSDVYVRELDETPKTVLASVSAIGDVKGNRSSDSAVISANGMRVAFLSNANNLDPLDKDMHRDVYVRDLDATPWTFLASVNAAGTSKANGSGYWFSDTPSISADGTRIAFVSDATNLDPLDQDSQYDIYIRELDASPTTILVSVNADGTVKGNGASLYPVISSDGTRVAFVSDASNLDPQDTDNLSDVYIRELGTNPTTILASSGSQQPNEGESHSAAISGDGSQVAFVSSDSALVLNDFNSSPDVIIRSVDDQTNDLASRAHPLLTVSTSGFGASLDPPPSPNQPPTPGYPTMYPGQHMQSADGRFVVFVSQSTNLISAVSVPEGIQQVYRYDVVRQEVELVSSNSSGTAAGNSTSDSPTISADGSRVAFRSLASNLDPLDGDSFSDIFVRELGDTPQTVLASVDTTGNNKGNANSHSPIISANGTWVVYTSKANNLHPLDQDSKQDVYVRKLDQTPATILASVDAAGIVKSDGDSSSASISADGTRVAFSSSARNLHPLDSDIFSDIYVRELDATPTTILASLDASGSIKGNFDSTSPVISANGKRVAFLSQATNLHPSDKDPNRDIYVRVLDDNTTTLMASGFGRNDSHSVTISADGTRVAFATTNSLDPLETYPHRDTDVYVRELDATGRLMLASVTAEGTAKANRGAFSPRISADGKRVVFLSQSTNLDPLDGDTLPDVYVRELDATPTTLLASVNRDGTAKGNGRSTFPLINDDGAQVVFVSLASNLISGDLNGHYDVFVREVPLASSVWQNPAIDVDVNRDGSVSPIDALFVINELNTPQFHDESGRLSSPDGSVPPPFFDVNGDAFATPIDALIVINWLNSHPSGEGELSDPLAVLMHTSQRPQWLRYTHAGDRDLSRVSVDDRALWVDASEFKSKTPDRARLDNRVLVHDGWEYTESILGVSESLDSILDELASDITLGNMLRLQQSSSLSCCS